MITRTMGLQHPRASYESQGDLIRGYALGPENPSLLTDVLE